MEVQDITRIPKHDVSEKQAIAKMDQDVKITQFIESPQSDDAVQISNEDVVELEKWNTPRINTYRFGACLFSLLIMGMNDACLGALLPYIEEYYHIDYTTVSTVFIVPFAGYVLAALSNNWIHNRFGQRGVAFLGPVFRLIGYIPIALHPPFPVLPIILLFATFGNGVEDGAYNAWVGHMHQANELLGLLHGAYGLGATISPLIASAMVTKAHLEWYTFFYVMIGLACLEAAVGLPAFWAANGAAYRERVKNDGNNEASTTATVLRNPITWLVAVFLLGYVGVEVSLGGWIPSFMINVRHVEGFLAGLTATLFWLGLTLGRIVLGFITGRIGERLAIIIYLPCGIVMQLLYWLVPNFAASIVFVIFLGFFMGPLLPAAVVIATKLLPPEHHVSGIGFAAAFGSGGAALLPFAVGAIAQKKGVKVLQPIVVALLVFIFLIWLIIPGGTSKNNNSSENSTEEEGRMRSTLKRLTRSTRSLKQQDATT